MGREHREALPTPCHAYHPPLPSRRPLGCCPIRNRLAGFRAPGSIQADPRENHGGAHALDRARPPAGDSRTEVVAVRRILRRQRRSDRRKTSAELACAVRLCRGSPVSDATDDSLQMVGLVRFELTTSCTPCKRATRLRYSPNKEGSGSGNAHGDASAFSGSGADVISMHRTDLSDSTDRSYFTLGRTAGTLDCGQKKGVPHSRDALEINLRAA